MLTNERIDEIAGPADYWDRRVFARAIEAAAVAPLLERIAELEELDAVNNQLIQTQHRCMVNSEQRGAAKGIEESAERIAALEAKLAQRVPEGWKLVPVKPTEVMVVQGAGIIDDNGGNARWSDMREAWDTMLSAAPAAPEQQELDDAALLKALNAIKPMDRTKLFEMAVPLTKEEIAEAESDRAIPSGRVFNIRAAFEDWYSDGGKYPKAVECKPGDPLAYILMGAQSSWGAWFAGVKALEAWIAEGQAPNAQQADNWLHLKGYGYAPGDYMNKCHRCKKVSHGVDKRATTCRPCAEAMHSEADAQQAEAQEPCAWRHSKTFCLYETEEEVPLADGDEWAEPLFTRPQPAQLQALSEEEVNTVFQRWWKLPATNHRALIKAAESALAAKNGAELAAAAMAPEEAE